MQSKKFGCLLVALAAVLVLRPGSAQANEIPMCQYILGHAEQHCEQAYFDSPAGSQCFFNSSKLTDFGKRYFKHPNMRQVANRSCQCDVKFICRRPITYLGYSGKRHVIGHAPVPFHCKGTTLEKVRKLKFNGDRALSSGCK